MGALIQVQLWRLLVGTQLYSWIYAAAVEQESTSAAPSPCPPMFDLMGSRCVYINYFHGTWEEAQYMCHTFDSELISNDCGGKWATLLEYLQTNELTEHSYWIDGHDKDTEGDWRYTNGDKVQEGSPYWAVKYDTYDSTYNQEPLGGTDENCLSLDHKRGLYMDDASCSEEKASICAVPSGQ